jgi:hypothetical protein
MGKENVKLFLRETLGCIFAWFFIKRLESAHKITYSKPSNQNIKFDEDDGNMLIEKILNRGL